MSDEEDDDSIGPDIDLEKLASDRVSGPDDEVDAAGEQSAADDGGHGDAADAHGHDAHDHDDHAHDEPEGRTTAPQSEYTNRQVAIGAAVTAVGVAIAYLLPGLAA